MSLCIDPLSYFVLLKELVASLDSFLTQLDANLTQKYTNDDNNFRLTTRIQRIKNQNKTKKEKTIDIFFQTKRKTYLNVEANSGDYDMHFELRNQI